MVQIALNSLFWTVFIGKDTVFWGIIIKCLPLLLRNKPFSSLFMSSISKNLLKQLRALHLKKNRQAEGLFLAEGDKIVSELLHAPHWNIERIFALPDWAEQYSKDLHKYGNKITLIDAKDLATFSTLNTPQKVAALVEIPTPCALPHPSNCLNLALDRLNDPGNLGTIIRIADWFNIPHIFCSTDCVELYNPKTIQATMGSIWRVKVFYTDLKLLFDQNKNLPVYGAVLDGDNLFNLPLSDKGFILIGSESHGIQADLLPAISQKITIPRLGQAESLNAAVATGIIAAHFAAHNMPTNN